MKFAVKPIAIIVLGAFTGLLPLSAQAANVSMTGGTNGPGCDSGGYFTPKAVSLQSGDTLTISVPSSDPYSGGLQIHGLPGGDPIIARGSSHSFGPLTASANIFGTWPDETACMKGSATITVAAAGAATPATNQPAASTAASANPTISPATSPSPSASPAPASGKTSSLLLPGLIVLVLVFAGLVWFFATRRRRP